ncbi:hypothetical protein Bca52824_092080 [Brassica carinata]|uniref:Uncharacterized protein n=1 Tax=Brassica carinata TaxID=52824 RepID=A0A8X7TFS6_BRACI|nr:hypothetical protein Bca52824_092080 [Brassica carinata]
MSGSGVVESSWASICSGHPGNMMPATVKPACDSQASSESGCDLIGEITPVKSTVPDPPQNKNRVMATVKMDNDMSVTISLFDSQAVNIHKQLDIMRVDPRVWLQPVSTPRWLVAQDTRLTPAAPLLRGYEGGIPEHSRAH